MQFEEGILTGVPEVNLDDIIRELATSLAGLTTKISKEVLGLVGASDGASGC